MTEPDARSRYVDRFLTFIDAIVAIAITLLVLPLVDLTTDYKGSAVELVREHAPELLAFALSFFVIFRFWKAQHRILRDVVDLDGPMTQTLTLWAFTVVFLPFPTALASSSPSEQTSTRALYVGTMAVSAGALALLAWLVARNPALRAGAASEPKQAMTTLVIFVVALVLTVAIPRTGYYPLLLLFLTGRVVALWHRHKRNTGT
ncbi:TMEM175 family protein [Antrihabitans sp. NCIMB 15449]|uniref:TMEM175 family protein n=1 Tax=Antrihabitans spumae TaxID=3373370 RepID=A0ABW7JNY8_9NOCA